MALQKKDFVEIEFTGKLKDGEEIFDSNIKADVEKMHAGHNHSKEKHDMNVKPFVFCLGEKMFLEGVEDFLIDKPENSASYNIEISPEKSFGVRNPKLVQVVPIKVFHAQRINPTQGDVLNFDGKLGKILSVSGGRVITDFNHPLAGKEVIYKVNLKRKVTDINEKVKALFDFFFRQNFEFSVSANKLIVEVPTGYSQLLILFKDKFKEILGLELEVKELSLENKKEISQKIKDKVEEMKN
ncbi:FKBP-type peptidyl-prolyl cis-trans isomerase [Candidatus Pacearchaeota archaeon]|nr:FKBP-type peptidyl-prolyl cis-trans isomerase [Candidatus Pacearchaeota archaeon]